MKDKSNILKEEGTDIVEKQIMSPIGDSEGGNLQYKDPEKQLGDEENVDVIIELLNKDAKDSFSPKYQEELANLAKQDPTSVMIETPEGWMTVAEAMKKGFNPESGAFDGETIEQKIDKIIAEKGLDPKEAARIKQMVLQKEAEEEEIPMGKEEEQDEELPEGEAPVEGAMPEGMLPQEGAAPEGGAPAIDPAMLAALGGGA